MRNSGHFFTVVVLLTFGPITSQSTTHGVSADRSEVATSSFGKIPVFFDQRRRAHKENRKVSNTSNKPENYRPPDSPGFNRDFGS